MPQLLAANVITEPRVPGGATAYSYDSAAMVRSLRSGDTRAFEQLFKEFDLPLRRAAYRIVHSREVAAELVQDVFMRVWKGREFLDIHGDVSAYLFTATRNRALDWSDREHRHRRWVERAASDHELTDTGSDLPAIEVDAELERQVLRAAIAESLAGLPPKRREICRLRWIEGIGPVAIAKRLGLSIKTVEVQITRGRKHLRERFLPERW